MTSLNRITFKVHSIGFVLTRMRVASQSFVVAALLLVSLNANAFDLIVVDQSGEVVEHAVVAIPNKSIESVKPEPAIMDQVDYQFVPHVLAVEQGRSVVFPNSDNVRHHVYSFSEPKRFEIKLYEGVPEQPIKFEKPGLIALGCNIHDSMIGYIFVSPWPVFDVTGIDGTLRFDSDLNTVAVWHPWMKGITQANTFAVRKISEQTGIVTIKLDKPVQKKAFKGRRYRDKNY